MQRSSTPSTGIAESEAWTSKAQLGFNFYCTQPQTLILTAGEFAAEIEITAAEDHWQDMQSPANKLGNPTNQKHLASWKGVTSIQLQPKGDADITEVLFAQFKWVVPGETSALAVIHGHRMETPLGSFETTRRRSAVGLSTVRRRTGEVRFQCDVVRFFVGLDRGLIRGGIVIGESARRLPRADAWQRPSPRRGPSFSCSSPPAVGPAYSRRGCSSSRC